MLPKNNENGNRLQLRDKGNLGAMQIVCSMGLHMYVQWAYLVHGIPKSVSYEDSNIWLSS